MNISQRCLDFLDGLVGSYDNILNRTSISDAEATQAIAESMVVALAKPNLRESIGAYTRNSYLSGISTHVVNVTGQTTQIAVQPIIRAMSGKVGEAAAMLEGIASGFGEAFPRFMAQLKTGVDDIDFPNRKQYQVVPNKTADAVLSFPIRLTGALDKGFSAVLERMEFNAMRHRIANLPEMDAFFKRQNITKADFMKELQEIALQRKEGSPMFMNKLRDLSPELHQQIQEFNMFNVYRSRLGTSALDTIGKAVTKTKETIPELNLVVPFVTTPINVVKEAGGYLPGVGMLRVFQAKSDIKALQKRAAALQDKLVQASNPDTQKRLSDKISRIQGEINFKNQKVPDFYAQQLMGAGLMLQTYSMVNQGMLTGHFSDDPEERNRQLAQKIPEMAIKIGDRWISYARLEPVATVMGTVADVMSAYKRRQIKNETLTAGDVAKVIGNNLTDKTFTEGLSKMLLAWQDSDRYLDSFIVGLSSPIVPALVGQVARMEDNIKREIKDPDLSQWIINNLKAKLPSLGGINPENRQTLPAQVNALGQEQSLGSAGGVATGIAVADVQREAVNQLFDNPYLNMMRTTRKIGGVELTGEQYADLEKRIGDTSYAIANNLATNPGFVNMPRPLQAKLFKNMVTEVRKVERLRTLGQLIQNPESRIKYMANEMAKYGLQPDLTLED